MKYIFLIFFLTGCATFLEQRTIRQSDLNSWIDAPVDELTRHPLFSTLPREVRPLADGGELHIYSYKFKNKDDVTCKENGWSRNVDCSGGGEREAGCVSQFIVKNGLVKELTVVAMGGAQCYTDCSNRPKSRPCQPSTDF